MLILEEQQELVRIIENLSDITDNGALGRRTLLEQSGLRSFVPGISLGSPAHIFTGDLVGRLERKGYLIPERPTFHALGALLSYVLTIPDLPSDQARFIARLIIDYALVLQPEYIDKLRGQYGITDTPVQPSVSSQVTTLLPTIRKTEMPAFDISLPDKEGLLTPA